MDIFLQIWGGAFYLTNKVLFALSETQQAQLKKKMKVIGWVVYILGVPAWVTILIGHHNWIAASIEAGGLPAMLMGLYYAIHEDKPHSRRVNTLVSICTYSSLVVGLSYSIYQHSGISSVSQLLEMGVMLGFLLGSYLMAKRDAKGWLFFMLMNLSMALLMFIQDKPILMAQQLASLCFVIYGYRKSKP